MFSKLDIALTSADENALITQETCKCLSLFCDSSAVHKAAGNHCCILLHCTRLSFGCRML